MRLRADAHNLGQEIIHKMQQLVMMLDGCEEAPADWGILNEIEVKYHLRGYSQKLILDRAEYVPEYLEPFVRNRPDQEQFWVIPLDMKLKPKGVYLVSIGLVNSTLVHSREVFRVAVATAATSILIAHNHPSGDPSPSSADIRVTRSIREAGTILGIELTDHVIVGRKDADPNGTGFYSFREAGLI